MKLYYYDIETYVNYFLFVFKDEHGNITSFDENDIYNESKQKDIMSTYFSDLDNTVFVGYNNAHFDSIFLDFVYEWVSGKRPLKRSEGTSASLLSKFAKQVTTNIIEHGIQTWQLRKQYNLDKHTVQLDLMNHSGVVNMGLKELGIRTGYDKLEALPYEPNAVLTPVQRKHVFEYCVNDVNVTEHIAKTIASSHLSGKFELITHIFGGDLKKLGSTNARLVGSLLNPTDIRFIKQPMNYVVPKKIREFLVFEDDKLNKLRDYLCSLDIGQTIPADDVDKEKLSVLSYGIILDFGLGGLHACKRQQMYENLIDVDVASMYPSMLREYDLFPEFVPSEMRQLYYDLIQERVSIKKSNPGKANAYKLVLNSTYGILNDKYSPLYSPNSAYSVTFTGQLVLAKLIEMFSLAGYEVMTANTDGITIVDNGDDVSWRKCVSIWEEATGLVLEDVRLAKTVMRDVNNYVWVTKDGKLKRKGVFDTSASKKVASHAKVSVDAVVNWVATGESVESYITKRYYQKVSPQEWLMYHKFGKKSYEFTKLVALEEQCCKTTNFDHVVRYVLSNNHVSSYDVVAYTYPKQRIVGTYTKVTKTGKVTNKFFNEAYNESKKDLAKNAHWKHGKIIEQRGEKRLSDATQVVPIWEISKDFDWSIIDTKRYIDIAKELLATLPQESVAKRREKVATFVSDNKLVPIIAEISGANLMKDYDYVYNENLVDYSVVVTEFASDFHRYMLGKFGQSCARFDWTDVDGSRKISFITNGVTNKAFKPRKNDAISFYSKSESSLAPLYYNGLYFEFFGNTFAPTKEIEFDKFITTKEGQISFD